MKKARKKRIVRRKRRISEREIMRIKRKLKKSARKLRLGAKRTGAYVYGTLRRIVGNPGSVDIVVVLKERYYEGIANSTARRFNGRRVGGGFDLKTGLREVQYTFKTEKSAKKFIRGVRPASRKIRIVGGEIQRNPLSYYVGGLSSLGAKRESQRRMRTYNQIKKSIQRGNASYGELAVLQSLAKEHPKLFAGDPMMAEAGGISEAQFRRLRGNGMDDKRNKWQLFGYDVWGNEEEGYNVNDIFPGPVVTLTNRAEYNARAFDNAMRRRGSNLRYSMIDQGRSDEDTVYFDTPSGKPIAEMRRLK